MMDVFHVIIPYEPNGLYYCLHEQRYDIPLIFK